MALIAPMAEWHPLTRPMSTTPLTHDVICLHTMVGTLEGSWSWSNRPGGTYWHFGIGGDGETWQCQDLRYRSAANLNGNWHVIPIETEDTNRGVFPTPWADPLWTEAQLDAIARLTAWLCVRFNIPPVLIPDTLPGRRGIGFHQQGIDPVRVPGGEKWSNAVGKTCPARRRSQVQEVIRRVQAIINPEDGDLPLNAADKQWIYQSVTEILRKEGISSGVAWLKQKTADIDTDVEIIKADLADDGT